MSKYQPRFSKESIDMLVLNNLFEADECLDYADRHNMNVILTETTSGSSIEIMMAFKRRGYAIDLIEKEVTAPDGTKCSPKVYAVFTRKGNEKEDVEGTMTVKEYNESFLPKIDAATCVISNMENDLKKTNDYPGCMRELKLLGWSEETKQTILTAMEYYKKHEGLEKIRS